MHSLYVVLEVVLPREPSSATRVITLVRFLAGMGLHVRLQGTAARKGPPTILKPTLVPLIPQMLYPLMVIPGPLVEEHLGTPRVSTRELSVRVNLQVPAYVGRVHEG